MGFGLKSRKRQRSQRRADETRRFDEARLVRLGREREQAPLAVRRVEIGERTARERGDHVTLHARTAAETDGDEAAHGLVSRHCTTGIAARQPVNRPTGSA